MTQIKNLADMLGMNERECAEYGQTIGRVLADNFLKDVFEGKMTMEDAITESVKLWDKKQNDMSMQLLSGGVGNASYGTPKMRVFSDASLDYVYNSLRN